MTYGWKRLLGLIVANAQSARWVTQGIELSRLWRGRVRSSMTCLDVGCGGGTYAIEQFLRRDAFAVLTDLSEESVRLARAQVGDVRLDGRAAFVVCNAQALPFADGVFDRIQALEILEHLSTPDTALDEMHRIAKAHQAELVVSVPHPPEWFRNPAHVVKGYDESTLLALLRRTGWRPERTRLCMLLLTRLLSALVHLLRVPVPGNFLLLCEGLVPSGLRRFLMPHDILVRAVRESGTPALGASSRPAEQSPGLGPSNAPGTGARPRDRPSRG